MHQIDRTQTLQSILQKYLGLKGFKNKDVYEKIAMKADTFSKIVCGRYKKVQKINILRLCIGLELTIQQAEEVMRSAGYDFSPAVIEDVIVKYCIINRIYSPTCVNIEFYDSKVKPLLFKKESISQSLVSFSLFNVFTTSSTLTLQSIAKTACPH